MGLMSLSTYSDLWQLPLPKEYNPLCCSAALAIVLVDLNKLKISCILSSMTVFAVNSCQIPPGEKLSTY